MKENNKQTTFHQGEYKLTHLKAKGLPFASLYMTKNIPLKYILAALIGVAFAILSLFFIKNTGGYAYGLASLLQGIARIISFGVYKSGALNADACASVYSGLYWGLLFLINIPLLIFAYHKIGKRFALLSLTFIAVATVVGLLLDLIPNINNIYIFGSTTLYTDATHNPAWIVDTKALGVQIIPFMVPDYLIPTYHPANYVKPLFFLVAVIVYAIVAGIVFSILYIIGGCTAGTDIIACYLSVRKGMDVALAFFIVNICCIIVGATLGSYLPAALTNPDCANYQFFFSVNFLGTLISLAIFTLIFKTFYPRGKKFYVQINSTKAKGIINHLNKLDYFHDIYLHDVGKRNNKMHSLDTVCSALELSLLLDSINKVDTDARVIVLRTNWFGGNINLHQLGSSPWKK